MDYPDRRCKTAGEACPFSFPSCTASSLCIIEETDRNGRAALAARKRREEANQREVVATIGRHPSRDKAVRRAVTLGDYGSTIALIAQTEGKISIHVNSIKNAHMLSREDANRMLDFLAQLRAANLI